jgi:hypothetical protein
MSYLYEGCKGIHVNYVLFFIVMTMALSNVEDLNKFSTCE